MAHSICKTKTDSKMLRKCLDSTEMVNSRRVSSNRHKEAIIALHEPYDDYLEHVFVLQNNPLDLQTKTDLKMLQKCYPDGKKLLCFFK